MCGGFYWPLHQDEGRGGPSGHPEPLYWSRPSRRTREQAISRGIWFLCRARTPFPLCLAWQRLAWPVLIRTSCWAFVARLWMRGSGEPFPPQPQGHKRTFVSEGGRWTAQSSCPSSASGGKYSGVGRHENANKSRSASSTPWEPKLAGEGRLNGWVSVPAVALGPGAGKRRGVGSVSCKETEIEKLQGGRRFCLHSKGAPDGRCLPRG